MRILTLMMFFIFTLSDCSKNVKPEKPENIKPPQKENSVTISGKNPHKKQALLYKKVLGPFFKGNSSVPFSTKIQFEESIAHIRKKIVNDDNILIRLFAYFPKNNEKEKQLSILRIKKLFSYAKWKEKLAPQHFKFILRPTDDTRRIGKMLFIITIPRKDLNKKDTLHPLKISPSSDRKNISKTKKHPVKKHPVKKHTKKPAEEKIEFSESSVQDSVGYDDFSARGQTPEMDSQEVNQLERQKDDTQEAVVTQDDIDSDWESVQ